MEGSQAYCCHDHIVLLVSKEDFENPPSWLRKNFNIIEGGTHSGGSSKNKLIVFSDGTYLELFTWISTPTEFTDWTEKPPGLIDFALTTLRPFNAAQNFKHLMIRLESKPGDGQLGVAYSEPKAGGRKRNDGTEIKWETTRPVYSSAANTPEDSFFPTKRGDAPFFCHDQTPRYVRVPFDDESLTTHPCGATGIASVDVLVPQPKIKAYATMYAAVIGSSPEEMKDDVKKGVTLDVAVPTTQASGPVVRVRIPTSDADETWLKERGIGIREISIFCKKKKSEGHGTKKLGQTGSASTVTLIW